MRLRISHSTAYRYRRPVLLNPHHLMLVPRSSHELRIVEHSLHCRPDADLHWTQDVYGNILATASFQAPAAELVFENHLVVDQASPVWPVFQIAPGAHFYPFDYSDAEKLDLGPLRTLQHADSNGVIRRWAEGFVYSQPTDTLSLLKDINGGMVGRVAYRPRDEEGTQAPAETLALASGSCRDIAALFIDTVRALGFGARAVSGYLYDPYATPGDPGSTHAWADVYLPDAGWIAFDPTQGQVGAGFLVPAAIGRCNQQIMPVSGTYVGAAEDFIAMDVRVEVTAV